MIITGALNELQTVLGDETDKVIVTIDKDIQHFFNHFNLKPRFLVWHQVKSVACKCVYEEVEFRNFSCNLKPGRMKPSTTMFLRLRGAIESNDLLSISFAIFLVGFFLFPTATTHKLFFYVAVIPPFLLLLTAKEVRTAIGSTLMLLCLIYGLYSYSTLTWGEETRLADYFKYGIRLFTLAAFFAVTVYLVRKNEAYEAKLGVWLCWGGVVGTVFSITLFYYQKSFPGVRLENLGHLSNSVLGGSAYGLVALISYYCAVDQSQWQRRWFYRFCFFMLFGNLLLTQSRGPLVALFAALGVGELLRGNYKLIVLALIAVVGYGVLLYLGKIEISAVLLRDGIFSNRLEIWWLSWQKIVVAPWFGHGIHSDEGVQLAAGHYVMHPHNAYLATMLYGGVVNIVLLLAIVGRSLFFGFREWVKLGKILPLTMLLFGLVCIVTDNNQLIRNPTPLWLFFWFPIALMAAKDKSCSQAVTLNG